MTDETTPAPTSLGELSGRLINDLATLDAELAEIDLLVPQAKAEATRHDGRRTAAAEKLAALPDSANDAEKLELTTSLVTLTQRAALMESQVDVLEGKRRALARYRDAVAEYVTALGGVDPSTVLGGDVADDDAQLTVQAATSRLVLGAQEDLRREIARAMHDGPAQSLTNIVLQAQIVERLVDKEPASAGGEVRQLIAMVQQTLDATKSFIFDVRPMVLDDLGLVPTLRRATRERGLRSGIQVDFDSLGHDRRLPMDLESGLFRMLDESLAAYLGATPDRASIRLDWSEVLEARVSAMRAVEEVPLAEGAVAPVVPDKDLPPALAAMMEDRRADERDAAEAAFRRSIVALPEATWLEIQGRAASLGVTAELLAEGGELRIVAAIPKTDEAAAAESATVGDAGTA